MGDDVNAFVLPGRSGRNPLDTLAREGWLELADDAVRVTAAGLLRVDSLLPTFYDQRYRNARYT